MREGVDTAFAHCLAYWRAAALFILFLIPHLPQGEFQDSFEGGLTVEPNLEVIIVGAKKLTPVKNNSKWL